MTNWIEEYIKFKDTAKDWKPTTLSPAEEKKFKSWLYNTQLFNSIKADVAYENQIPLNEIKNDRIAEMMLQSGDYDYRGAFKYGVKEEISPYDNLPHWSSRAPTGEWLKSPTHDTAWKEFFMNQYGIDPDSVGMDTFEKAVKFVPPAAIPPTLDIFKDSIDSSIK